MSGSFAGFKSRKGEELRLDASQLNQRIDIIRRNGTVVFSVHEEEARNLVLALKLHFEYNCWEWPT
jgi:hypothetical protein